MIARRMVALFCGIAAGVALSDAAHAWDPNADITPVPGVNAPGLPSYVVPRRYYRTATPAPATVYAPVPQAPGAPGTTVYYTPPGYETAAAPAPEAAPAAYTSVPVAPAAVAPTEGAPIIITPPVAVAPAVAPAVDAEIVETPNAPASIEVEPTPPVRTASLDTTNTGDGDLPARRHFKLGVEAFYDRYREPQTFPDLKNNAYYGALDVGLSGYLSRNWFASAEGRFSYGANDYKSRSGTLDGVPQWEVEPRILFGYDFHRSDTAHLKYFSGIGARYFFDDQKGRTSSTGVSAYQRSIFQLYLPVGMTYEFQAYGLTMAPTVEYDQLIYGYVVSHLQDVGMQELRNIQNTGYGLRGEFLISNLNERGSGWQLGPFIRYWNIEDSNDDTNGGLPPGYVGREPKNTRMQIGAKMNYLF